MLEGGGTVTSPFLPLEQVRYILHLNNRFFGKYIIPLRTCVCEDICVILIKLIEFSDARSAKKNHFYFSFFGKHSTWRSSVFRRVYFYI